MALIKGLSPIVRKVYTLNYGLVNKFGQKNNSAERNALLGSMIMQVSEGRPEVNSKLLYKNM